jgi:hypothetical protein
LFVYCAACIHRRPHSSHSYTTRATAWSVSQSSSGIRRALYGKKSVMSLILLPQTQANFDMNRPLRTIHADYLSAFIVNQMMHLSCRREAVAKPSVVMRYTHGKAKCPFLAGLNAILEMSVSARMACLARGPLPLSPLPAGMKGCPHLRPSPALSAGVRR